MATVTAAFARTLAGAAGFSVTETGDILSDGRIVHSARMTEGGRMSDADYFGLIDWIRETHPDRTALALAYGRTLEMDDLGALGLAIKTAPTLRDSILRVERYYRLLTDTVAYRMTEVGGLAVFEIETRTGPYPVLDFRNECALAAFCISFRRFGGPGLRIDGVSFRHLCPTEPARYADALGCPVTFGAERDAITLASAMLDLPNRLGDRGVSAFLTAHLDAQISALPDDEALSDRLVRRLTSALSEGVPSAAEAAQAVGVSERTLYRRLSEEGKTYQGVLRQVQQAMAEDLLARDDCSIAEIAFLTGFAEQSTFSRAFKRWVGQPPASYRRTARAT